MMEAIRKLRVMGYRIELDGQDLRLTYTGPGTPNPAAVRPLLAELRRRKAEAVAHLRGPERLKPGRRPYWLTHGNTCYACGGKRFWLSVYGVLVCAVCHPSAAPELVAEWVGCDQDAHHMSTLKRGILDGRSTPL